MLHVIPHQLPWWVAGPGVGACVVLMYGLANAKLGVSGGWLQLLRRASGQPMTEPWRAWFNGGLVAGALLAAVLGAGSALHGYGRLSAVLAPAGVVVVALLAGVAMGYGARWAGGCTSGHGLSGCAARSRESLAATATFFSVAVGVTLLLHAATGGSL
ncbi:MAG: YeeE/YedE family protein [Nocardioides sp.]